MLQRVLEQRIELARKKMEDSAMILGLGHPKVYQLSQELDRLHNQWEKEYGFEHRQSEQSYRYEGNLIHVNEARIERYKIVV